jgi:polyisoprenoid-binding protein YceI
MKKTISILLVGLTLIITSAFTIVNSFWKVKEGAYSVSFTSKKVDGEFKGLKAQINFDEENLERSKILATIDATTINTGIGLRNKHARAALGADEYPVIKFESNAITKKGVLFEATGMLTIHNVVKKVVIPFTVASNGSEAVFEGKFSIATKDFEIIKMGTPDVVEITLKVPVTK